MKTMKALVYERPGRANASIKEVPYPVCGDTQLIVKVMSCGICKPAERSHDHQGSVLGQYPATPGHEFAGVVEEIGHRVTDFQPGDRVTADNGVPCKTCYYCQKGQPAFCESFGSMGHNIPGGLAQYVVVEQEAAFHIPEGVSTNAACLSELVGCCYRCVERSGVQYGDDVLILGCGSSGMLLAQMFRHSNARAVVVADKIASKLTHVVPYGIDTVLVCEHDYTIHEKELLERYPRGFDRVIDTTGVAALCNRAVGLLKKGGTFVAYSFPTTPDHELRLDLAPFLQKELTCVGSNFQTHHFGRCLEIMQSGKVDPEQIISHEFPLERYFEALDLNLSDESTVKIIIHPNEA